MAPGLVAGVGLLAVLGELTLYYVAPHVLAPLAFIPVGKPVSIELDRLERDGLVEPVEGERGYRERRSERIALERIADEQIFAKRFIAWIRPAQGTIIARTRYGKGVAGAALIRARLRVEGDRIVATTRQLPCPFLLWPLMALALLERPTFPIAALTVLFGGLQVLLPRRQLAAARDESLEHFRAMIHAARRRPRKQRRQRTKP